MRSIGILTGAFDPIHLGHLRITQSLIDTVPLDEVVFVPLPKPEHRAPSASIKHRRNMVQKAIDGSGNLSMPDLNLKTESFALLNIVRGVKNLNKGARIFFIIGADRLQGIALWPHLNELFSLCELIVCPRDGRNTLDLENSDRELGEGKQIAGDTDVFIAAELVRAQIRLLNDAPEMLLPDVAEYIAANGLYQPDYLARLKGGLGIDRLAHTVSVRETAVYLARVHGVCMQKAGVAGILHDCAKDMPLPELRKIALKHRLTDNAEILASAALLHGIVGAFLTQTTFNVHDPDILNAVRYHTMGRPKMSMLELCIFVADAIEPRRSRISGLDDIRTMALEDLRAAALMCLLSTKQHLLSHGRSYSLQSQAVIDDLIQRVMV